MGKILWFGMPSGMPQGTHVALYLAKVMKEAKSPSPIVAAAYGISWAHVKAMVQDPCVHPLVLQVREAAKRMLSQPVQKKKPLSALHVRALVDGFAQPGAQLKDLQTVLLIVLGFAGFLRWNDLSGLLVEHMSFHSSHLLLYLPKRKNDQFYRGHHIHISRSGQPTCPVALTERFLGRSGLSTGPLFTVISGQGSAQKISDKGLSYAQARRNVLGLFSKIGLDCKQYGLHSLRAGGATCASKSGVSERLISAHGGWRSAEARNGYIRDDQYSLLSVSKALQL